MRLLTLMIVASVAGTTVADCAVNAPAEQLVAAEALIARTKTIVLAKVVAAETPDKGGPVLYTLKTIKSLKGAPKDRFTISGGRMTSEVAMRTFDHHYDPLFWHNSGGRSHHYTNGEIYPTFAVGGYYVIFLERPYHRKSFEFIIRTNGGEGIRDKWLTWVEQQTNAEQAGAGQPATAPESKSEGNEKPQPESKSAPR